MNKNIKNNLGKTKTKLTILFSIVVFLIVFILQISFFSIKYINSNRMEINEFNFQTTNFINQVILQPEFLINFQNKENFIGGPGMRKKQGQNGGFDRVKFLNFLVLNKDNEIVLDNINENIGEIDMVGIDSNKVFYNDGFIIKKVNLGFENYNSIVFVKKQFYPFSDYINDITYFTLISLLFSFIFYFIGGIFVSKILFPVEKTLQDMDDFIHNASHELKTPISVINSNMQLLKELKTFDLDLIHNSVGEIKRLDNLIIGLSELSKLNNLVENTDLDLENEINEILKELTVKVLEKNIKLDFKTIKNINLKINKNYFYIMFSNLVINAIKYNVDFGYINIILDKNKLTISNSGYGIEKNGLDKIFDRFYKGEKGRNTEGFGIGLSLVKKICDIYKWTITVKSEIDKETTFEIKF